MRGNTTTNLPFFFKLNRDISLDKMECAMKKLFEIHPILKDRIELGDDQQYYNFRNDNREVNIERLSFTKEEWEEKKNSILLSPTIMKREMIYTILDCMKLKVTSTCSLMSAIVSAMVRV